MERASRNNVRLATRRGGRPEPYRTADSPAVSRRARQRVAAFFKHWGRTLAQSADRDYCSPAKWYRVSVELSIAPYQIDGHWEFSGFVRDITDKKVAEASTRRHREMEMELAHANRVATMGQLSASIAHEVNQPIGAAVTNAHAALRWLGATPPNMDEVHHALSRIVANGNRATDVLSRIRAFIKKAPPRKDSLEVNQAVLEVVALTRSEAKNNKVAVQLKLTEGLPVVQ